MIQKEAAENYNNAMTLEADLFFFIPFSFCFLPVHLSDPQRVEVSEPFNCSRREKGGQKGCDLA